MSITTPLSHLANEFDVRSELHGQVSFAAVNQILCHSWGYERLQKSKDSFKACFENVNIHIWALARETLTLLYANNKGIPQTSLLIPFFTIWKVK